MGGPLEGEGIGFFWQPARKLPIASWHAVDTVACWASLQAPQEAGAFPAWMMPPTAR